MTGKLVTHYYGGFHKFGDRLTEKKKRKTGRVKVESMIKYNLPYFY